MDSSSTVPETHCHVRSNSMPSRSHPYTLKVENALSNIKSMDLSPKADIISMHLTCLVNLYNDIEDLIQLPLTQQVLEHQGNKKWVEDLLDGSVRVLDVCSSARDFLLTLKEKTQDLRISLRRRGGHSTKEEKIVDYISFRKKMKKDVSKCLGQLKRMDTKSVSSPQVKAVTISFFHALLSFLCSSSTPKSNRWSSVLKLKHKRQVACEGQQDMNELQCVDFVLQSLSHSRKDAEVEPIEKAKERLDALEANFDGMALEVG